MFLCYGHPPWSLEESLGRLYKTHDQHPGSCSLEEKKGRHVLRASKMCSRPGWGKGILKIEMAPCCVCQHLGGYFVCDLHSHTHANVTSGIYIYISHNRHVKGAPSHVRISPVEKTLDIFHPGFLDQSAEVPKKVTFPRSAKKDGGAEDDQRHE